MEWIGPLLIGGVALLTVLQLFWAHTISAITEKTDQSELMQVLAWIPILQLAPTLAAGGSSIGRFLVVAIFVVLGNGALVAAAAALGGLLGSLMVGLGLGLSGLLGLVYFGRVASNTAIARDLPGWLGLLIFVPILNFVVYPYIAFHDGWTGPNKLGLAIGLVLTLGSSAPTFQAVMMMNEPGDFSPDAFLAMAKGTQADTSGLDEIQTQLLSKLQPPDLRTSYDTPDPASSGEEEVQRRRRQQASLRVLYQLKSRFDELDLLTGDPSGLDAPQRAQASGIIQSIRRDLDLHRSELDPTTYHELGEHLLALESRLESGSSTRLVERTGTTARMAEIDGQIGPAAIRMGSDFQTPQYGDRLTPPSRPFPIQASESCPDGTERRETKEAKSELEWCQQLAAFGGLRHGWYAKYLEDGRPESMGQYENGLRVGVWTRFYPTGEVRAQAEFEDGMQHGWVLTFDRMGERTRSARYQFGTRITLP